MWGWIKDPAKSVWDGVTGGLSSIWNGLTWLVHRVIGLIELIGSLLGIKLPKKLRLRVVILLDDHKQPVASRADVDTVVDLAKVVFKERANVRIVSAAGSDGQIVTLHPQPAPGYVMNPKCDAGGYWQSLSRQGRWFRRHSARTPAGSFFGYGAPATIFVVKDVQDKNGCFVGVTTNYGFIDEDALPSVGSQPGRLLTLAHELGHACDLVHPWLPWQPDGTLMKDDWNGRTRRLTRRQQAVLRSSPRVTYL